jgi:Mg-chelatase subunit ChlD
VFDSWPPPPTPLPSPTVCKPEDQAVDVALVIDTSGSMFDPTEKGGKQKLQAAIDAAIGLVNALKTIDQTTVVGFNINSYLMTRLTSDKAQAIAALRQLPTTAQTGTSIDRGLTEGLAELMSPRHKSDHHRSMVLLTDGRQNPAERIQAARDAADAAKGEGILMLTIGLGADVDTALLTYIASAPRYYYAAPKADDLERIYHDIAQAIPCP